MSFIVNFGLSGLWIINALKKICLCIDAVVYGIAASLYGLFDEVVKINSAEYVEILQPLEVIIDRIQVLIGIFVLFRLAISLLQRMVDPDEDKGATEKIITNVVISIILLASSGFIFDLFDKFQDVTIGSNNVMANLVFGVDDAQDFVGKKAGTVLTNKVFLSFFRYDDDIAGNIALGSIDAAIGIGSAIAQPALWVPAILSLTESAVINSAGDDEVKEAILNVSRGTSILTLFNYVVHVKVDYKYPVISTIAGVALCFYFWSFAIDIAIRMFKLLVLEIISPVPILLYIDPKSSKYLQNFFTLYLSTFLELYIRLFIIYIAILLSFIVMGVTTSTGGFLLTIIILFALFHFAKQLPNMIRKVFNLDFGGAGDLKGKGFLTAVAGGVLGLGLGYASGKSQGLGWGQAFGTALTGAARGMYGGATSRDVKTFIANQRNARANNAKQAGEIAAVRGWRNYLLGRAENMAGVGGRLDRQVAEYKKQAEKANAKKEKIVDLENKFNDYFANSYMRNSSQKWGTEQEFAEKCAAAAKSELDAAIKRGDAIEIGQKRKTYYKELNDGVIHYRTMRANEFKDPNAKWKTDTSLEGIEVQRAYEEATRNGAATINSYEDLYSEKIKFTKEAQTASDNARDIEEGAQYKRKIKR